MGAELLFAANRWIALVNKDSYGRPTDLFTLKRSSEVIHERQGKTSFIHSVIEHPAPFEGDQPDYSGKGAGKDNIKGRFMRTTYLMGNFYSSIKRSPGAEQQPHALVWASDRDASMFRKHDTMRITYIDSTYMGSSTISLETQMQFAKTILQRITRSIGITCK